MPDSDFWWRYRVLGHNGLGSVIFNARVDFCENPPNVTDLESIEKTHEAALAYPGVTTAVTMGPMRAIRKDA